MATIPENPTAPVAFDREFRSLKLTRVKDWIIIGSLAACTLFTLLITISIVVLLFGQTIEFFRMPETSVSDFLLGTKWNPTLGEEKHFGIWPLICGTLWVTVIAMAVALPLGLVTAIYLSEYAPRRLRNILKPTLELLAGIPTVVYGFFALAVITPFLLSIGIQVDYYNALSAGIAAKSSSGMPLSTTRTPCAGDHSCSIDAWRQASQFAIVTSTHRRINRCIHRSNPWSQ